MKRLFAVVGIVILVMVAASAVVEGTGENGRTKANYTPRSSDDSATRAVVMQTIYDDGDATSDTFVNPPITTTGTYQDNYIGVKAGVTGVTAVPFSIETVAVFMRHTWNVTVALWKPSNLASYAAVTGIATGVAGGFNTFTLATPVVITNTTASNTQWYMAAWQSFPVASPSVACTTCRVIGVDTAGVAFTGVGFHSDNEISAGALTPVALAPNSVPVIRAGINATATTVPVELLQFSAE